MDAKKVARYGLLTALALVLSWLESLLPSPGIPGVKLGLANLVVVFALYRAGWLPAVVLSLVRVLLVSFLFGNGVSLAYSLSGAVLSLAVMIPLKASGKFSETGVCTAGGVAHNAGQLIAAVVLLGTTRLSYYLPVLCVSGTFAGAAIGLAAAELIRRVPDRF